MSTDLHIHTNLSDGRMSPTEVIETAIKKTCSIRKECELFL